MAAPSLSHPVANMAAHSFYGFALWLANTYAEKKPKTVAVAVVSLPITPLQVT